MTEQPLVVLSTAPDDQIARRLANVVVEANLAACVNIVGGIRSVYRWQGEVHDDAEVLLVCKTDADHLEALTAKLVAEHPYECPEVIALPIVGGAADYLAWIQESLGEP